MPPDFRDDNPVDAIAAMATRLKGSEALTLDLFMDARFRTFFQFIIDQIPDHLWIKDTQHRFVAANRSLVYNTGGALESDFVGRTDFEIFPTDLARQYHTHDEMAVQQGGRAIDIEEAGIDPNGQIRWYDARKTPLRDQKGRIIGTIGIARDITERRDELFHIKSRQGLR